MPNNEKALLEWQIGKQTVFGTAVAPTLRLMGVEDGKIVPNVEGSPIVDQRGSLIPAHDTVLDRKSGTGNLSTVLTFEDIGYWLDMMMAIATPSGAGPYTRVYLGADEKPTSYLGTLAYGNSDWAKKLIGASANSFGISTAANGKVMGSLNFLGHSVEDATLSSLADRAVNYLHANLASVYIDAAGGSFGGTELENQKHTLELSLDNNRSQKEGIGSVSPIGIGQNKADVGSNQLKMSVAVETETVAFYQSILTTTQSGGLWKPLVRIEYTISANLKLTIDYAGYAPNAPEWVDDVNGISSLEFTLNPIYDATLASWMKATLINGVATHI